MIRPLPTRGHAGGPFAILRPRVVDRIASAATHRITLIVAPGGYGKSIALTQYLKTVRGAKARYDVMGPQPSLSSFVRGFADALKRVAPEAKRTAAEACDVGLSSQTPGLDLAIWMGEQLKDVHALIVVDDLHVADENAEIATFLQALIEHTKACITWIIASRTAPKLPIASWLAYADMDFQIDDRDLRFTLDEAAQAASMLAVDISAQHLDELLTLTEGWPAALGISLRTSVRSADLRNVAATTREMIYRYLAEQVYESLTQPERELLHLVCFLPEIDLAVLKHLHHPRAKSALESLRDRVSFIYLHRPGVYRCHDLFREFVRHQVESSGEEAAHRIKCAAAEALQKSGHLSSALRLYADARAFDETLALLERHGFELYDQGGARDIQAVVESLPTNLRSGNALVVGLRGLLARDIGDYAKTQALLERAISLADSPELRAALVCRLARLRLTLRLEVGPMLESVEMERLSPELRAEVASLLAIYHVQASRSYEAITFIDIVEATQSLIESDAKRWKLLMHIGNAAMMLELPRGRLDGWMQQALALAKHASMHRAVARTCDGISRIAMIYAEDHHTYVEYATQALRYAKMIGDNFAHHAALLSLMEAAATEGDAQRLDELDRQYRELPVPDPQQTPQVVSSRMYLLAWQGRFSDAHRLLLECLPTIEFTWERSFYAAACALLLVADGEHERGLNVLESVFQTTDKPTTMLMGKRQLARAKALCAAAYALAGRGTKAWRLLRSARETDSVTKPLLDCVAAFCRALENPVLRAESFKSLKPVESAGQGGIAKVLDAIFSREFSQRPPADETLTTAELAALRALAAGQSPKDVAAQTGRSVHTVRTLISRAIQKLACNGRQQAIVEARNRGLLD